MKMLIEKQAAAAAHLNSPSRLEAFAADTPPRRRRRPGTPTKTSGAGDCDGGSRRGGRGAISSPPSPRRTASAGGIALSELVSATTPPRRKSSALKMDHSGGAGGAEQRRALAQETYTKTFTGMQVLVCSVTTRLKNAASPLAHCLRGTRELGRWGERKYGVPCQVREKYVSVQERGIFVCSMLSSTYAPRFKRGLFVWLVLTPYVG